MKTQYYTITTQQTKKDLYFKTKKAAFNALFSEYEMKEYPAFSPKNYEMCVTLGLIRTFTFEDSDTEI